MQLTLTPTDTGINVVAEFDTGWNAPNECGGWGRNEYSVEADSDGVAELKMIAFGNPSDHVNFVWVRGTMYFTGEKTAAETLLKCTWKDGNIIVDTDALVMYKVVKGTIPVERS